eukprot:Nitzschia sp. Nitz4//scaffold68_size99682//7058//9762//NITZ4_004551-RA/size99682-snap-gene-0.7-mRNA-1//-1//CDS//3329556554//4586//frame0
MSSNPSPFASTSRRAGIESDDDDDFAYRLPHYATSKSKKSGTKDRPIKIPDLVASGTSEEPIWISDQEVSGTDTETDTSNVAIKGTRMPKPHATNMPATVTTKRHRSRKTESSKQVLERSKAKVTRSKKVVAEVTGQGPRSPLPANVEDSPTGVMATEVSPKATPKLSNTSQSKSVVQSPVPEKASPKPVVLETPKKNTAKDAKVKKSPRTTTNQKVDTPEKTVEAENTNPFGEEDPALEKELEEIALTGRSGMISGTPGAHDIEKGKNFFRKPAPPLVEDEADRSWHSPITTNKPRNQKRQRLYLIGSLLVLLAVTAGMIQIIVSKKRGSHGSEDNMSKLQKSIDEILQRTMDSTAMSTSGTPQYKARKWLLFQDSTLKAANDEEIIQRFSLATFYFASGGDSWSSNNWLTGSECGDEPWSGLNCDDDGGVRAVVLDNEGLSGTIASEVGHLSLLEHFVVKNNPSLYGWIPTTLARLTALSQIGLYGNSLSGSIPDVFARISQVSYINLEGNNLFGSIPASIKYLTSLDTLALSNNKLSGVVPVTELAETTVKYLSLSSNKFSSMLETNIDQVSTVEYLYLNNNTLRGPVPAELGSLTNLKSLDLGNNVFSGTVPTTIGALTKLEFLSMNGNSLTGSVPYHMGHLTGLKALNLANNQLVGRLPAFSNMVNLVNLQLYQNQFTGTIPEALSQLQNIEVMFLSSNQLTGTIPASISRISTTLRGLYLSDNGFHGRIPSALCSFSSLEALFLDTNELFGPIPSCLGELVELQQLYLFQNQLTGEVPSAFENLKQLSGLGVEENSLTGDVPNGVCDLVETFSLDIWADCTAVSGSDTIGCTCCSVCCPSKTCT